MKKQYLKCPECGARMSIDREATGRASKRHGSYLEHRVAKHLTKATGFIFKKTPASGGMHLAGDIFCIDHEMQVKLIGVLGEIECKNREDITAGKILKDPEFLLEADKGEPLISPKKVAIFNNGGQLMVIIHSSVGALLALDSIVTRFQLNEEAYYMGDIDIVLVPVLQAFAKQIKGE